ncbi:hypothetical protein EYF80_033501 [Liparis tanakae]|uniref:Uncharacterized protein n=1 Tax=Liparis tanakae TaxID=230148 RepID=A0A4Z2GT64_9TELE|nr:hypothetical protein EYF80_033501 [Liparis tanakae]
MTLWDAGWRWLLSFPGVDVLSLALDLGPGFPAPSWLSTSDVLPEELFCRDAGKEGERVKDEGLERDVVETTESRGAEVNHAAADIHRQASGPPIQHGLVVHYRSSESGSESSAGSSGSSGGSNRAVFNGKYRSSLGEYLPCTTHQGKHIQRGASSQGAY